MLLGIFRPFKQVDRLIKGLTAPNRPVKLGEDIMAVGSPKCAHRYQEVPWDSDRLGPGVVGFDDPKVVMGMATFKTLMRCSCGAEKVERKRALY